MSQLWKVFDAVNVQGSHPDVSLDWITELVDRRDQLDPLARKALDMALDGRLPPKRGRGRPIEVVSDVGIAIELMEPTEGWETISAEENGDADEDEDAKKADEPRWKRRSAEEIEQTFGVSADAIDTRSRRSKQRKKQFQIQSREDEVLFWWEAWRQGRVLKERGSAGTRS